MISPDLPPSTRYDSDEAFLALHEELERLKRQTKEVGMEHEFKER